MLITLTELFPNWQGIMTRIQLTRKPIWISDSTVASRLDMLYFGRSGEKYVSPLVSHYITDNELSESSKDTIIDSIYDMYSQNWEALWKAVSAEYEPLENYDRTTTITETNTRGDTKTIDYEHTDTDTGTLKRDSTTSDIGTLKRDSTTSDTGTLKTDNTNATDATSNIYAFDSTDATPEHSETNTNTGSSTDTHDLTTTIADTDTHDLTTTTADTDTHNLNYKRTSTETHDNNVSEHNTHNERVHGNIGVTTSQQMLMSEYELRERYKFYEQMFKDVDKCLTLAIY